MQRARKGGVLIQDPESLFGAHRVVIYPQPPREVVIQTSGWMRSTYMWIKGESLHIMAKDLRDSVTYYIVNGGRVTIWQGHRLSAADAMPKAEMICLTTRKQQVMDPELLSKVLRLVREACSNRELPEQIKNLTTRWEALATAA